MNDIIDNKTTWTMELTTKLHKRYKWQQDNMNDIIYDKTAWTLLLIIDNKTTWTIHLTPKLHERYKKQHELYKTKDQNIHQTQFTSIYN